MDNSLFLKIVQNAIPLGERTSSSDFLILSNANSPQELQRLAFFDSRGKKILPDEDSGFIANRLARYWDMRGEKYLVLTRTHASTTFFTLLNFLNNLQLNVSFLITNVGFVDFTPKKKSVIDDIMLQGEFLFRRDKIKIKILENYELSSGKREDMLALDLEYFVENISEVLQRHCQEVVFIATHEIDHNVQFERVRPASFFQQLKETNKFLQKLKMRAPLTRTILDPPMVDGSIKDTVFDGVHFTRKAHELLFSKLQTQELI